MLTAMLLMTFGFWMYSIAVILSRSRCVILEREQLLSWNKPVSMSEAAEAR
jgi:heme exporter protein C